MLFLPPLCRLRLRLLFVGTFADFFVFLWGRGWVVFFFWFFKNNIVQFFVFVFVCSPPTVFSLKTRRVSRAGSDSCGGFGVVKRTRTRVEGKVEARVNDERCSSKRCHRACARQVWLAFLRRHFTTPRNPPETQAAHQQTYFWGKVVSYPSAAPKGAAGGGGAVYWLRRKSRILFSVSTASVRQASMFFAALRSCAISSLSLSRCGIWSGL